MQRKSKEANELLFVLSLLLAVALAFIISFYIPSPTVAEQLDAAKAAYLRADYAAAFQEFIKLAKERNAEAQFYLGDMFSGGKGVPQNYCEAVKWYRKAADQGHRNAQFNLGAIYFKGEGVPQDHVQAYMWFTIAARGLHLAVQTRNTVAGKMTPEQIAEGQRLAAAWRPS
jgi:hypothetical protein